MSALPTAQTPLNQHSLQALERWLQGLGAEQQVGDPCRWVLNTSDWSAELALEQEDLRVTWRQTGRSDQQCCFPYGLCRADVEAAIDVGP